MLVVFFISFQGYQFWTQASKEGIFSIKNVRAGNYSLYAWVPGIIGDYKYNFDITVQSGIVSSFLSEI